MNSLLPHTQPMDSKSKLWTPPSSSSTSSCSSESDDTPFSSHRIPLLPSFFHHSHRSLAVLSGHVGTVSCLALCGEFILSASQGKDIIVWQQPDLRLFTKFGQGDGSVKALATVANKVFTAHQDSRIRFMKQSNYVQTRRHHKRLWIEHADSISCLTVSNGFVYSGSWDKSLKVWRISDLKCLESLKAHDDAINGLVASKGVVYSASADGKIKAWGRKDGKGEHCLKGVLEGRNKDASFNSVVVSEDGKWIFGGGSDGFVMGWERFDFDSESWKLVSETKAHEMAVLCLCLTGEFLCSGSADKSIGIWRREAFGKLCRVGVISGHEGPVKCLQASSHRVGGGFLLYSGSLDKSLRVWWVPRYGSNSIADVEDKDSNSAILGKMNESMSMTPSIITC
ncbi:hypothetical protein Fmac_022726 [Flemingia macrophylla]|uniref:Transducin/WD40 repeat-like superfamily protein n=1 Tax=Flemingia macrophylla TaxID=520843 RepID=A0ABD1M0I8_9FABA